MRPFLLSEQKLGGIERRDHAQVINLLQDQTSCKSFRTVATDDMGACSCGWDYFSNSLVPSFQLHEQRTQEHDMTIENEICNHRINSNKV